MSRPAQSESTLPISAEQSEPTSVACCQKSKLLTPFLAVVALASMMTAAYFAGQSNQEPTENSIRWNLPQIDATASASSEKFSIATGLVSPDAEGLFVLDHNSGLLQCNVIYPRVARFLGEFKTNVAEGLGTGGKGGEYIMVTGQTDFPSSSANPAASCIIYVMDTGTGNYAAYGIPFNRQLLNSNRPQSGAMVLLHQGTANPLIDRDNLR